MDNVVATEVRYWDVLMIVSELYIKGRNRSWISHKKKDVVDGLSLPISFLVPPLATADAAADMLICVFFW